MSWTTSTSDLRTLISDGATDKYNFKKQVFGDLDGINQSFKTLEVRRITDFTLATLPQGVFVNGAVQVVSADFPITGEFTLQTAPNNGDKLEASYYSQWFLDSELATFLQTATNWCIAVDDVTSVDSGLRPSVLHYAAAEAYQKLSLRFARMRSEEYRVEDEPDKKQVNLAMMYEKAATNERSTAETLRAQFYKRNDQSLQPLFSSLQGSVTSVQPKR